MYALILIGDLLLLAAMISMSVGSLLFYIKFSGLPAAIMFVSSVVTIMSVIGLAIYPYILRGLTVQAGSTAWQQYLLPVHFFRFLIGISAIAFAIAFWQLLRHVEPADHARSNDVSR
jgi:hypothetical protein